MLEDLEKKEAKGCYKRKALQAEINIQTERVIQYSVVLSFSSLKKIRFRVFRRHSGEAPATVFRRTEGVIVLDFELHFRGVVTFSLSQLIMFHYSSHLVCFNTPNMG